MRTLVIDLAPIPRDVATYLHLMHVECDIVAVLVLKERAVLAQSEDLRLALPLGEEIRSGGSRGLTHHLLHGAERGLFSRLCDPVGRRTLLGVRRGTRGPN